MAARKTPTKKPRVRVGILMGSESDRGVVEEAGRVLEDLGIGYEILVRSAHRTPDAVRDYSRARKDPESGRGPAVCQGPSGRNTIETA